MFSYEFYEISKNILSTEHLQTSPPLFSKDVPRFRPQKFIISSKKRFYTVFYDRNFQNVFKCSLSKEIWMKELVGK